MALALVAALSSCVAARHLDEVGVMIYPGDDVFAVVGAHPAGTAFVFASGVHRLSRAIAPRDGDAFLGQPGAVLSGARLLTSFAREGGLWVASGQSQEGWVHGSCLAEAPRCDRPEDLFVDDVPLRHVGSLGEVGPGSWFFDYAANRIYFADDPAGRVVEASVASGAIVGDADDVTVRGLVVEKFANQAQRGAIMAIRYAQTETYGARWTIEGNTVRLNHGVGIKAGYGAYVLDNRVLRNGQLGIGGGSGPDTVVERNEIAYNNWAGFDWNWEAGGTKFVRSDGLVVRDNHVHHNEGPGLWTDIDNIHTLYEGNLVEHNANNGIFHEISYDAIIRNNIVRDNGLEIGLDGYAYVYGAGILVSTSSNVTVYGNVVEGNWNGIVGVHGDRGTGAHGVRELRNLQVHDNIVGMQFHADGVGPNGERGVAGMTGVVQNAGVDYVFDDAYATASKPTDTVSTMAERHFSWANARMDFARWQGYDHDLSGAAQSAAPMVLAGR